MKRELCVNFYYYCYFQLRTAALKAYCAIWVRRSNFHHQASPRLSLHESTQRRKVELWAKKKVREFCLNAEFHVTFRDLLHAVKLRHGNDGFTSPPKEGVLRIFFAWCELANLGTKGQHAYLLDHRSRSCVKLVIYKDYARNARSTERKIINISFISQLDKDIVMWRHVAWI